MRCKVTEWDTESYRGETVIKRLFNSMDRPSHVHAVQKQHGLYALRRWRSYTLGWLAPHARTPMQHTGNSVEVVCVWKKMESMYWHTVTHRWCKHIILKCTTMAGHIRDGLFIIMGLLSFLRHTVPLSLSLSLSLSLCLCLFLCLCLCLCLCLSLCLSKRVGLWN
jgi:hypothetical protein